MIYCILYNIYFQLKFIKYTYYEIINDLNSEAVLLYNIQ